MRKVFWVLLALLAVRLAGRAARRQAEVTAMLWELIALIAGMSTSGTPKSRSTEDRLNALVPRIPVQQPSPNQSAGGFTTGGNSSFGTSNSSFGISGQNTISSPGGSYSQAWAQQVQATVSTVFGAFNALQGSYSNTVPAVNALQGSYSTSVSQLNSLSADHNRLVTDHGNLLSTLGKTGVIQP